MLKDSDQNDKTATWKSVWPLVITTIAKIRFKTILKLFRAAISGSIYHISAAYVIAHFRERVFPWSTSILFREAVFLSLPLFPGAGALTFAPLICNRASRY